ncbi:MAG TPA: SIMPL domain-containing protein [Bacillota bacterium]|nr:SIMPL domain-containing protein [Bacillota bacterium]
MKKIAWLSLMIAVVVLISSLPGLALDDAVQHTITVTGEAEVNVIPDEVILSLGVETSDKDLNIAKKLNDERIKKIISFAKTFQIDSKYIQTDYLDIEPRYANYEKQTFLGYYIRKNIVITLKDISKFDDLLSGVLTVGANYVHGIQFKTTELRKYKDQARKLAIKAAQEKAVALSGELGQKIGKPINISEDYADWFSSYRGWWGSAGGGVMTQNVIQNAAGESMSVEDTVAPGQIGIKARITVIFELE